MSHPVRPAPGRDATTDGGRAGRARDARLAAAIERWFTSNARSLPWRTDLTRGVPRDPWASLVSEVMLQQTQASRVAERLPAFLRRFPNPAAMAAADEHDVLAAWSGLGYYRRARSLHACAQEIVARHAGAVPRDVEALRSLPGVGAYTAGAVASIVFGARTPIVDANVARVLLRVGGVDLPLGSAETTAWAWTRASALVAASRAPGVFNEGLMELGALVCTPSRRGSAGPRCAVCPLSSMCIARRSGRQHDLPARPKTKVRSEVHHAAVIVRDDAGRVLLERRPDSGLWSGMWQPPTVESASAEPTRSTVAKRAGVQTRRLVLAQRFDHHTTHRTVRFTVWVASGPEAGKVARPTAAAGPGRARRSPSSAARAGTPEQQAGKRQSKGLGQRPGARPGERPGERPGGGMRWVAPAQLAGLALASPHRRMLVAVTLGHSSGAREAEGR